MKNINKEKIMLLTILIIQIVVYIIMGSLKTYIHMDEAYSIGLTNYNKIDITSNEDFYDNWHNKEYYEDYLSIGEDEVTNLKPVYENQKNDVHPPFYYLLLRIASSFSLDKFSKWPGIILNIIILTLSNILVYKILNIIMKNKKISLSICLVNGLVISSIESLTFIRMYALNSLILLFIAYIHLINFRKYKLDIKSLILMGSIALIASLTHYYNVIYIGVIFLIYIIKFIKNKQYKNLLKYLIVMIIAAIASLLIFPHSISHIFMGYRGQGVLSAFNNPTQMAINLCAFTFIITQKVFNGMLWLILAIFIIKIVYELIKQREITIKVKIKNMEAILIMLPAFVYFLVVAVASPYIEIRYMIPICSFVFIYVMYLLLQFVYKYVEENVRENVFIVFLIVILIFPIFTNQKIDNLYLQHKDIVKAVEEKYSTLPTIYLFNTSQNRFLDDIYLFTKFEKSYILNIENANEQKIDEILKDKDIKNGIIVWVNEGFEREEYLDLIKNYNSFENCEHIKRMNACDIYYIY